MHKKTAYNLFRLYAVFGVIKQGFNYPCAATETSAHSSQVASFCS